MKKELPFGFAKFLLKKNTFKIAAFTALTFLTAQNSLAQTWVGATSTDFLDGTNWSATPTFTNTDVFTVNAVVAPNFNPTLSAVATCASITTKVGSVFTTTADFTTSSATSTIEGTVNINGGTWTSPKLYIGSGTGGAGVVNVTGATLSGSGIWRLGSSTVSATHYLNINNGGILNLTAASSLTIGFTSSRKGVLNINTGGLAQIVSNLVVSSTTGNGTINIAGGSLEYTPVNLNLNAGIININSGSLKFLDLLPTLNASSTSTTGVINIGGGTLDTFGPLTIGSTTTGLTTINLNSGTMNITGALAISAPSGTYTGMINIDAGSIVLTGNQTATIATLVSAGKIAVSGAALTAGKSISNTYSAITDKTTVVTAVTLGLNDTTFDTNSIVVYAQNQGFEIQSTNSLIADVKVYDVKGSLIASKNNIASNSINIALNQSNEVYVVKVTTTDGAVVTKKIVH